MLFTPLPLPPKPAPSFALVASIKAEWFECFFFLDSQKYLD